MRSSWWASVPPKQNQGCDFQLSIILLKADFFLFYRSMIYTKFWKGFRASSFLLWGKSMDISLRWALEKLKFYLQIFLSHSFQTSLNDECVSSVIRGNSVRWEKAPGLENCATALCRGHATLFSTDVFDSALLIHVKKITWMLVMIFDGVTLEHICFFTKYSDQMKPWLHYLTVCLHWPVQ